MKATFLKAIIYRYRHAGPLLVPAIAIMALLVASTAVHAQESAWKIGRGVVTGRSVEGGATLKISLRNAGAPSPAPVRIVARWSGESPGGKMVSIGDTRSFTELGLFDREVRMKQTVIVEMVLIPLGPVPGGRKNVEVAVITGDLVTDGAVIPTDF